jgi:hypothetical protein
MGVDVPTFQPTVLSGTALQQLQGVGNIDFAATTTSQLWRNRMQFVPPSPGFPLFLLHTENHKPKLYYYNK